MTEATALAGADTRLGLLIDAVQEYAIFVLDPQGRIASWNAGAERIKGWTAEEAVGRHVSLFYPPEDVEAGKPQRLLDAAAAFGRVTDEGWRVRKDGSRLWASVVLTALRDDAGTLTGFAKITRDDTDRRQAQAQLESVADVSRAILSGVGVQLALVRVVEHARELAGAALAWVATVDPDRQDLRVRAADGRYAGELEGRSVPASGTLPAEVIAAATPHTGEGVPASLLPGRAVTDLGSALYLPLTGTRTTIGVLAVVLPAGATPLADRARELVTAFAAQAAVALEYERARLELQRLALVEDRERIARDLHDGVIQRLFATGMSLQGVSRRVEDPGVRSRVDQAVADVDDAIRQIRTTIFAVHAAGSSGGGLRQEVLQVAAEATRPLGVPPSVTFEGPVDAVVGADGDLGRDLLLALREALTNVAKHARAGSIEVTVSARQGGPVVLTVADDGVGPGGRGAVGRGLGNLDARARIHGGHATLEERPGGGSVLTFTAIDVR